MKKFKIVEQKLGIPPDYQYKAIRSKNFVQSNWHNNKLVVLEGILKLTKASSVLDLGCGSGNFELAFAKKLKKITAIDYNDEAIRFLNSKLKERKIKNVNLIQSDLKNFSRLKNIGKYDLVVSVDVIEHLKMSDAEKLISSLNKVLNKNGHVCIITPNYKSPWLIIERILDQMNVIPHFAGEQHLAKFYKENIKYYFSKYGFIPVTFATFNLFSFMFFTKYLSSLLTKFELSLPMNFGNLLVYLFKINKSNTGSK